ncbi:MAG: hypothetical protein K2Q11_10245 [Burkholderiaceae bacterium]|nr:hypothetical protein [Burkholderiaceae bacterium]
MRPSGEVRAALQAACEKLAQPDQGVTMREMAAAACVGVDAARRTVDNMRRAGQIAVVGKRLSTHCDKPVLQYALVKPCPALAQSDGCIGLAQTMGVWQRR